MSKTIQLKMAVACMMVGALILACTDENIVNVPQEVVSQGISGRIVPPESGATVAAWQAREIKKVTADDSGYFSILGLPPGLYELRVSTPSGAHRTISEVDVKSRETTALGTIQLAQLPAPLLSVTPADESNWVSPLAFIRINSQEPLSLALLESDVSFAPPLSGHWFEGGGYYSSFEYRFEPTDGLSTATAYEVTIGPRLHRGTGLPPGTPVRFRFQTDSLRMSYRTYYGNIVAWNYLGAVAVITFNAAVDPTSVSPAISFEPSLAFQVQNLEDQRQANIVIEDWPGTGTSYSIIVSNSIVDKDGKALANPDTIHFASEALSVQNRYFPNSQSNVPPILFGSLLEVSYSVPIGRASALAAVSIDPPVPLEISFSSSYYGDTLSDELNVRAPEGLVPGQTYHLTIAGTLSSYDGKPLGTQESFTFVVQPLKVTLFGFDSYPYYGPDTVIAPGSMPQLNLRFNANVDIDALNSATTIDPAIPGFWYETSSTSSGAVTLAYFPTGAIDLPPEQTYTVTLDGSAGLVGAVGLGADATYRFYTEPVMITNFSPARGSQIPSYYYPEVSVRFNSKMNRASVEAAFSLTTYSGNPVTGTFSWYSDYDMRFVASTSWISGTSYKADVNTTAQSASGAYLKEAASTFFRAQ